MEESEHELEVSDLSSSEEEDNEPPPPPVKLKRKRSPLQRTPKKFKDDRKLEGSAVSVKGKSISGPKTQKVRTCDLSACDLCDLKFKSRQEKFTQDETVHLAGGNEEIDDSVEASMLLYSYFCGKASMTPRDLSAHNEDFYASELKYRCLSCVLPNRRRFFSKAMLKAHNEVQLPAGPYTCALCTGSAVTFDLPSQLDNHLLRVHTHLTEFPKYPSKVSEECENDKQKLIDLQRAKRRAIRESYDLCRFCGVKKMKSIYGVKGHQRKEHGDKFIHLCTHPECGNSFVDVKELRTCQEIHREGGDGPPYKCFVCNAK